MDKNALYFCGTTAEGLPFSLVATYEPGVPDGASPISMTGDYVSKNGGGTFAIERADDDLFYLTPDDGTAGGREKAWDLLPWVIADPDAVWERGRALVG